MKSLLIEGGTVLPCDGECRTVHRPGYVFVRGERIEAVGPGMAPDGLRAGADEIIDASGHIVAPGLVNAHTHLFQTFLRGLADDKPLLEWLETTIWPAGLAMTEEDFYLAALLGCVENLKCGATSILNQDYVQTSPRNADAIAEAAFRSGARVLLARGFADREPYHPSFRETPQQVLRETERLVRKWNTGLTSPVRVEFGPLIPWGCRTETLQTIDRLAREWDVGVHIHLSETRAEVQMSIDETGMTPARWLHHLGLLNERWQLVHGVWLDDEELDMIAAAGALIVHCPISNMLLASGNAAVTEWRRRGIPTALATDGPASNNSQDMLEVLKFTACLQKSRTLDPLALPTDAVLEMAWAGGARAMRMDGQIGRLAPGALADIILVDTMRPHIAPVHVPQSALVYNANGNDVDTVIVGGKILMRDGRLTQIDERRLVEDCQRAAEAMFARAGIQPNVPAKPTILPRFN
ncbi:MAG: amidohydrolase family protein [Anaerolineae bacterium]